MGEDHDQVRVEQVVRQFGDRSYGPMLFVPALLGLSPIGAIPGVPAFLALLIAITAAQLAIGREHLWLPGFINRRAVAGDRLSQAADRMAGAADRLDRMFHGRIERLVDDPFPELAAVIVLALCVLVVPLELLPFAAAVPMGAIAAFGLALMVRDGLLMLVSLAIALAAGWFAYAALSGGAG